MSPADFGPSPLLELPGAVAVHSAQSDAADTGNTNNQSQPGSSEVAEAAVDAPKSPPVPELDAGVAWHYGDPLGEQRAAESGPILLDHWNDGVISITGPERLSWLHSLSSQQLEDLGDGFAAQTLLLSARGHIEHVADVMDVAGTTYLRTEPLGAQPLLSFLESMKFWTEVDLTDVTGELASLELAGSNVERCLGDAWGAERPTAGRVTALSGEQAGYLLRGFPDRVEVVVPREQFATAAGALLRAGAKPAGAWAAAALRIAARRPRFGIDSDHRTLPNETPWLDTGVRLNKGCYRGQETVARIDNIGQPPRRTVLLSLDGSAGTLPATGDAVTTADGKSVGRLGSVAYHCEDGPIALALVRRNIGPDTPLLVGGVDAAMDPADQPIVGRKVTVDRSAFMDFRRR